MSERWQALTDQYLLGLDPEQVRKVEERLDMWGLSQAAFYDVLDQWFHNFHSNEKDLALKILLNIDYYNAIRFMKSLQAKIGECRRMITDSHGTKAWTRLLLVLPDQQVDSARRHAYDVGKAVGLHDDQISAISDLSSKRVKGRPIVLFNDTHGTGNQFMTEVWPSLSRLKVLPDSLYLVSVAMAKEALKRFQSELPGVCTLPDTPARCARDMFSANELARLEQMGKRIYPGHALGWGGTGLLVAYYFQCPNNSLPHIWADGTNNETKGGAYKWEPLFPYKPKPKESRARSNGSQQADYPTGQREHLQQKARGRAKESSSLHAVSAPTCDWADAPTGRHMVGRRSELARLKHWMTGRNAARVIAVVGAGGIGKTSLSVEAATVVHSGFDGVIWRSLRNSPPAEGLLSDLLDFLAPGVARDRLGRLDALLRVLIEALRRKRYLLVLDNLEALLKEGEDSGAFKEDYREYEDIIARVASSDHRSCLVLTSREMPRILSTYEGADSQVRYLRLGGMNVRDAQLMLRGKRLTGQPTDWRRLVKRCYNGNPLALLMVAEHIRELYGGDIRRFVAADSILVGDVERLISEQFGRLSVAELRVADCLALEREPVPPERLREFLNWAGDSKELVEAAYALKRRHLIEKAKTGLFLQNVVLEYATQQVVNRVCEEMLTGNPAILDTVILARATASDYVGGVQRARVVLPIVDRLVRKITADGLTSKVRQIVAAQREGQLLKTGFLTSNLITLLSASGIPLSDWDFSELRLFATDLRSQLLHRSRFDGCHFDNCAFADTFGSVSAVAYDRTGQTFAAGAFNGQVRVWRRDTGDQVLNCIGHEDWVSSVSFSPDGLTVVSASADGRIKLWDLKTGKMSLEIPGHTMRVRGVAFHPNGDRIYSVGEDGAVRVWDAQSGKHVACDNGHGDRIKALAISSDGNILATGGDDKAIRIWDADTLTCRYVLPGFQSRLRSLAIGGPDMLLASGSDDGCVRVWNMDTGGSRVLEHEGQGKIWAVDVSSDGRFVVAGGNDGIIRLWRSHSGRLVRVFHGHTSWIRALRFSPCGRELLSGSEDQTLRLWNVATGRCIRTMSGYTRRLFAVAWDLRGETVTAGLGDHSIRNWRIASEEELITRRCHRDQVWAVVTSPSGDLLASGSDDRTVRVWRARDLKERLCLVGHEGWIGAVAFSPDERILGSGSDDCSARLWDISSGKCVGLMEGHTGRVSAICFSKDGRTVITGSEDGQVRFWDAETGKCSAVFDPDCNLVFSCAITRDGLLLAIGGSDGSIHIIDTVNIQEQGILKGHQGAVWSLSFAHSRPLLVSGSDDRTISLWDTGALKRIAAIKGHKRQVWSVAFSPDDTLIASGSEDETLRIWSVATQECLHVIRPSRPYEGMSIAGATGLARAQESALLALGARSQ